MAGKETPGTGSVKVLSIVWFNVYPPRFGGQKAVALFNKYLAEHVSLLCLCSKTNKAGNENYRIEAMLPTGKGQVLNPFAWYRVYATAKHERSTHLLLEFPYYGLAGIVCKKMLGLKLIVNTHNIEYRRFKEQKKWWWRTLFHLEKLTLRSADAIFFKTEKDLKAAQTTFGLKTKKLTVVPYGVEEKHFDKATAQAIIRNRHGIKKEEKILFFAGTLDYVPNAQAVENILKKLIPLLNQQSFAYKILVCGRNRSKAFQYLNALQREHLILLGEVDDVEAYFKAADVFINPVQTGGGVQTKTFDALSYHLNVVSFSSKAEGIEGAENKIFGVAANNWPAFANEITKALEHDALTSPAFFETYNWRSIAAQAYQKILVS